LVKLNTVEPEEAWRKAMDKIDLAKQFESAGITYKGAED
jgi:hypothetical protein